MITAFQSVILGIVEGFTEFLPVSSTAHLTLASDLLGIAQSPYTKTFEIAIQSGAILAVVALYWQKFLDWGMVKRLAVAFVPTGILGLAFYHIVKTYLLGNIAVVLVSLAGGGLVLILFERLFRQRSAIEAPERITYRKSFGIGLCQSLALIPGVSRSAATIVGGMLLGVKREAIVEFSFLLAVPTMLAATGLDAVKSFHELSGTGFLTLGIGLIVSFLTALLGIKFLLGYVRRHTFTAFGAYRIILVLAFLPLAAC